RAVVVAVRGQADGRPGAGGLQFGADDDVPRHGKVDAALDGLGRVDDDIDRGAVLAVEADGPGPDEERGIDDHVAADGQAAAAAGVGVEVLIDGEGAARGEGDVAAVGRVAGVDAGGPARGADVQGVGVGEGQRAAVEGR